MGLPNPNRPIRIEGDVAFVPLTKGYEARIDAEDVAVVAPHAWSAMVSGRNVYAVTSVKGETVYMRRLFVKPAPGRRVRSAGDTLDCRKETLGIVGKKSGGMGRRAAALAEKWAAGV